MAVDILQETLDLLSTNWTSGNTDDKTPSFSKITDNKRLEFGNSQDHILAQRSVGDIKPVGLGDSNKHEIENFNIDIRVLGSDQESHWLNVVEEVKRIFDTNKINPMVAISETHEIEFDGSGPDLSNKTYNLWRKILPTQLKRYNIAR